MKPESGEVENIFFLPNPNAIKTPSIFEDRKVPRLPLTTLCVRITKPTSAGGGIPVPDYLGLVPSGSTGQEGGGSGGKNSSGNKAVAQIPKGECHALLFLKYLQACMILHLSRHYFLVSNKYWIG
jgi:hypothetical protein